MKLINIGKSRYGEDIKFAESESYNVVFILAKPRYGKSILVKNLYTEIAEYRPVIIFDYQAEHKQSKWGNWRSKDKCCFIPDLHNIENFGFYLTDFDQMYDWVSLGFSEKSALLLMQILKCYPVHRNIPERLIRVVQDLPVQKDAVEEFNERYKETGLFFYVRVHESTQQSLVTSLNYAWQGGRGLIIPPVDSEEHAEFCPDRIHVEDWGQYVLDHPHLNINLNIQTTDDVPRARACVGKILEKMVTAMYVLKPLIVVEEADFLCPNDPTATNITSLYQLQKYVLKHQRTGVELMFISQDPNLLDQNVVMGGTIFIMGQHSPSWATNNALNEPDMDYAKDIIHKLKYNRIRNEREFAIMESGNNGKYKIFEANDSCTRIGN